jgi:hypothetical protein
MKLFKPSSTQSSTKTKEDKKKVKKVSSQDVKTSQVKKASTQKENKKENDVKKTVVPKKPLTPYFAFLATRRENFKSDNPTLSITEIAKGLG